MRDIHKMRDIHCNERCPLNERCLLKQETRDVHQNKRCPLNKRCPPNVRCPLNKRHPLNKRCPLKWEMSTKQETSTKMRNIHWMREIHWNNRHPLKQETSTKWETSIEMRDICWNKRHVALCHAVHFCHGCGLQLRVDECSVCKIMSSRIMLFTNWFSFAIMEHLWFTVIPMSCKWQHLEFKMMQALGFAFPFIFACLPDRSWKTCRLVCDTHVTSHNVEMWELIRFSNAPSIPAQACLTTVHMC